MAEAQQAAVETEHEQVPLDFDEDAPDVEVLLESSAPGRRALMPKLLKSAKLKKKRSKKSTPLRFKNGLIV